MIDGHRYVGVGARFIAQLIDFLILGISVLLIRLMADLTGAVHRMTAHYPAGDGPEAVLAVGRGLDRDILVGFLAAIGVALLAGAGALAITIITFLKRRKARQRVGVDIATA